MKLLQRNFVLFMLLLLVPAGALFAQGTTGTLSGTVVQEGTPLPGVTVSVTSPNLQGTRTTVTNENGGYNFGALPPGDYTVRFELSGLQTSTQTVHVGVAQNSKADAAMKVTAVSETLTVTGAAPAVAETPEIQTNFPQRLINNLPIGRTIVAITQLAPGVSSNGVNGLSISGGMSYDNLYMTDGAVIQENLRGQPHNLFIEDAIQETTVQTGAISAEFGNFTGGVVNAITRSGGNTFTGSFRDTLNNPSWVALSQPAYRTSSAGVAEAFNPAPRIDLLSHQYEETLGGRILRDRLWFFAAGRRRVATTQSNFSSGGAAYNRDTIDKRFEGKLTGAITPKHNLVATYVNAPTKGTNDCQVACFDPTAVDPQVANPNSFETFNYNGVITNNLLLEGKYTKKKFAFVGYGGDGSDRILSTPVRLQAPGFGSVTNQNIFCGTCGDELRNNDTIGAKASYFLGTKSLGTHTVVGGVERWHEMRLSNNYQTPTDYQLFLQTSAPTRDANGNTLVTVRGGTASPALRRDFIQYYQIPVLSQGSNLRTDSAYVNDRWDITQRVQLSLGARYDKNDSTDSAGHSVANDSKVSPRLNVQFDPFANGALRFHGGYAIYVGRLAETVTTLGSAAGNSAIYQYAYDGPDIVNVTAQEALKQVFAWFDARGGVTKGRLTAQSIPGASRQILGSLVSPNVREYTGGVSTTFRNGFVRADYINRDWRDFYDVAQNLSTGKVTLPSGAQADRGLVINNDDNLTRNYHAIELQSQYKLLNRVNVGLNYTWSRLNTNNAGESTGGGPFAFGSIGVFEPEYFGEWNSPVGPGDLEDQTHKARLYASFDLPTFLGNFNFSAIERYESGLSYGLPGTINIAFSPNFYGTGKPGGVVNPGYVTPPASETYWFANPGAFRFPGFQATDLAVNYDTRPTWTHGVGLFVEADLINAFNKHAALFLNRSIITASNDSTLKRFNPNAGDVPVEGVHWRKGPLFGKPTAVATSSTNGSFQQPRTFRVSLGLRF
jgi:hypothetical protein